MKKLFLFGAVLFLLGCKELLPNQKPDDPKRRIVLDFQLGMSAGECNKMFDNLLTTGKLNAYENKIAYIINPFIYGHKYYSSPVFRYPQADTTLTGLSLYYVDDLDQSFPMYVEVNQNRDRYFKRINPESGITNHEIVDDIVEKVSKNYGSYNESDSFQISRDSTIKYKWNNVNDVEITLTHTFFSVNDPLIPGLSRYYIISLDYKYTEEMMNKLKLNKSIY